jgi:RNA polymerase sigma factor (sigma-70 family)
VNSSAVLAAGPGRHLAATPDAGGLYANYSAQILAYCRHHLGSRSDAEDALQTTFLLAHRALRRGVVPECESAWLTAIARNVCRAQHRTRTRRAIVSDSGLDPAALPAPAEDDRSAAVADLKEALASLPERQRRALLLREWQGLCPSEIAPRLGASTSETYALLARARRAVASQLTSVARRPVLGIDFGSLLLQLRALLAGGPATIGATAVAIAAVGAAGVTVDRAVTHHHPSRTPPVARAHGAASERSVAQAVTAAVGSQRRAEARAAPAPRVSGGRGTRHAGRSRHRPAARQSPTPSPHGATPVPTAPPTTAPAGGSTSTSARVEPTPASARPGPSPAPAALLPPASSPDLQLPETVDPAPVVSSVISTVTSAVPPAPPTDTPPPAPLSTPPVPPLPAPVGGLLP